MPADGIRLPFLRKRRPRYVAVFGQLSTKLDRLARGETYAVSDASEWPKGKYSGHRQMRIAAIMNGWPSRSSSHWPIECAVMSGEGPDVGACLPTALVLPKGRRTSARPAGSSQNKLRGLRPRRKGPDVVPWNVLGCRLKLGR